MDYEVQLEPLSHGRIFVGAVPRWVRYHGAMVSVVSYLHPDDYSFSYSGRSVATLGILGLPDGELLCSYDVYWPDEPHKLIKIFSSRDGGRS